MIHPLFPSTFYTLNGAYWSLGLEWQLYLALPLLIVGVRRFGLLRTALAAVTVNVAYRMILTAATQHGMIAPTGLLATVVLPNQLPGRWAEFVFGMVVAELYVSGRLIRWAVRPRIRWFALAAILVLVPVGLLTAGNPLSHLLFGGVFFVLVAVVVASDNVVSRIFSWRPLVALGVMSYSLYLVHQPLVQAGAYLLSVHAHTSARTTFALLLAGLPLILLAAWLLFWTVERHTLTSHAPIAAGSPERAPLPLPSRGETAHA
jgi:peptidoglycan/LPS O-acetylase OafA/YrhL